MNLNSSPDSFNELLFEDRNKSYGAYQLRTSYQQNISRSMLISGGIFSLMALLAMFLTRQTVEIPDVGILDGLKIHIIDVTPPVTPVKPPVVPPKLPSAPKTSTGSFLASDEKDKKNDQTNEQLNLARKTNPVGPAVDSVVPEPVIVAPPPVVLPPPVVRIPDKMPELTDLYDRVKKHLRYPSMAADNFTSGTVYVSFIVNTDGSISDIEVLKPLQDGCTEEAVRVTKLLTGWTPGYKDGKPVRVPCTLPIKFVMK